MTAFDAPAKIRWSERSTNAVTVPDGGYHPVAVGDTQTRVTIFNNFEGHGVGKLLGAAAARAAQKDAPAFAPRIKPAVEAS